MPIQTLTCPCTLDGTFNNDLTDENIGADSSLFLGINAAFPSFLSGLTCRSLMMFAHPGQTKTLIGAQLKLEVLTPAATGMAAILFLITARAFDEIIEGTGTLASIQGDGASWSTFNGADAWDDDPVAYTPVGGIYPADAPGHDVNKSAGYSQTFTGPRKTGVAIIDLENMVPGLQDWLTNHFGEYLIMLGLSADESVSKGFAAASRQHPTAMHPVLELQYSAPPGGRGRGRGRGRDRGLD